MNIPDLSNKSNYSLNPVFLNRFILYIFKKYFKIRKTINMQYRISILKLN